jgi:EAL domain-containing protein (putative c-di-GMP-specific phosphodiesterase class I)/GGDEF domain-containing protein
MRNWIEKGVDKSLVLLVVDIDGVEFVLKTFGPGERDTLLGQIGRTLQGVSEPEGKLYYITQNRFTIVLSRGDYRQVKKYVQGCLSALREPFEVAGIAYHVQAFVGISHYPNHAKTISELVRTAVFATHQARESEYNFETFDLKSDEESRFRFSLMLDLEHALEDQHGIRVAYQPQVDLKTNKCIGVEALCRWNHSTIGEIPPGDFLPFVEQTPLMLPLTEAILSQGLQDLTTWRLKGFDGELAVNLSPSLFRLSRLLDRLLEHFRFSNMPMGNVHFEITETGIMDQPNRAINLLSEMRRRGSRIAVDDFGTGHSSLAYLADLPIDIIKIDKYFIQNLDKPWGRAIVGAASTLAEQLDLVTIAEGIETESQLEKCKELGVTVGQGFYLARPMFAEDLEEWLGL